VWNNGSQCLSDVKFSSKLGDVINGCP
jgi:hypothetical protein